MTAADLPAVATPAAPTPAIAVENIVKRYGTFEAVKGVTFEVADGEIFGLLGPNGAGKSTLIRMMTTLIPVTAGRALIAGHDVSPRARRGAASHRRHSPGADQRHRPHRRGKPLHLRQALRRAASAARAQHRRAARSRRSDQMARGADQDPFRRHETAAGNRARSGPQPAHLLSRRTDDRARSGLPRRRVGDAGQTAQRA